MVASTAGPSEACQPADRISYQSQSLLYNLPGELNSPTPRPRVQDLDAIDAPHNFQVRPKVKVGVRLFQPFV